MAIATARQQKRLARQPIQTIGFLSLIMASVVVLPILSVISTLRHPTSDVWSHIAGTLLTGYALNSALLALGVGLLTAMVGIGAAFVMTNLEFPGRRSLQWMLVLPLAIPPYIMAYVYYDLLSVAGPVQTALRHLTGLSARELSLPPIASLPGAIFVLTVSLFPYVYIAAWAAFAQQGKRLVESARSLGCSPFETFRRVSLPLARPAIVAGCALVLMETMAEYGALSILGVQTFTTGIYKAWFNMGDRVAAAQLATMLLAIVILLVWLERANRQGMVHETSGRGEELDRQLKRPWAALAITACLLPWFFGFALPAGYLSWLVLDSGAYLRSGLSDAFANTLLVAGITALIAVLAGLVMIYGTRLSPHPLVIRANRLAAMGYAVPGPVLAIGALVIFGALDQAIGGVVSSWLGGRPQLWLSGTMFILIYVYLARFMTISLSGIEAGFLKIKPSMEEAAAILGYNAWQRLIFVHAKLIAPSLAATAVLVFVDVIKELPATLILRPFNFDTLAVEVFQLASDERLREAAAPALMLVAIGLLPAWLLSRTMRR